MIPPNISTALCALVFIANNLSVRISRKTPATTIVDL